MTVPKYDRNGDGQVTVKVELLYDFSAAQKELIWSALDTWERVSNVNFSTHPVNGDEAMSIDVAQIGSLGGTWGIAYDWGGIALDVNVIDRISDEYFTTLVLHEVGHILGLSHQDSDSVMIHYLPSASSEPTAKDIANLETFYGKATEDTVAFVQAGGTGDQEVVGNAGRDILYGNQGADTLSGRGGDDMLFGGQDADRLAGGDGSDILYGNRAADLLEGGDGNDSLYGGQEGDTLSGGAGDDFLVGGRGGDLFVGGGGHDTITDFSALEGDLLSAGVAGWNDREDAVVVWFTDGSSVTLIGVNSTELGFALV